MTSTISISDNKTVGAVTSDFLPPHDIRSNNTDNVNIFNLLVTNFREEFNSHQTNLFFFIVVDAESIESIFNGI